MIPIISSKWFTVLELMVGIVIFTMWFMGAYLLVDSANSLSIRSKDQIVGANLMREQIELIKNVRDTNWLRLNTWDSIRHATDSTSTGTGFVNGKYYTISNDYDNANKIAKIAELSIPPDINPTNVIGEFKNPNSTTRLWLDSQNRYVHTSIDNTPTNYATFFLVESLGTKNAAGIPIDIDGAHKITVFFASLNKGYRLQSMSTIITDWKSQ